MSDDSRERARKAAEGLYALLQLGDHVRLPNTTVAVMTAAFVAFAEAEAGPKGEATPTERVLREIVSSARNGNEPGQTWMMVAGGLIDSAEEILESSCDASTPPVQKDTENGTNGPSENLALTSKSDATSADCGLCGSDEKERQEIAALLGVPLNQVHKLSVNPASTKRESGSAK